MMRVVAIGECMLELSRREAGGWDLADGGDTYNSAVHLARLGFDCAFLTALGQDPFSDGMRDRWMGEGLDMGLVLTDPDRLPGLYAIRTDAVGERSFFYWRERSAARRLFDLPGIEAALDQAMQADLLLLSGITLSLFDREGCDRLVALSHSARGRGARVAFDPNYRATGWPGSKAAREAVEAIAPAVTVALPTFADEALLHGDVDAVATSQRWLGWGAEEVVVKLGSEGCLVSTRDATELVPAAELQPVDTTGAGDAFNAGYLAARAQAADPVEAARFANRLAGETTLHRGAVMPRSALRDLPRLGMI